MFCTSLTGNSDVIISMVDKITQEITRAETRAKDLRSDLTFIDVKKRTAASRFGNSQISELEFQTELKRLSLESTRALMAVSDVDTHITTLRDQKAKLNKLCLVQLTARSEAEKLKSIRDDYLATANKYANAIAEHKSVLDSISEKDRVNYTTQFQGVDSMLADLSARIHTASKSPEPAKSASCTCASSQQCTSGSAISPSTSGQVDAKHKCMFEHGSRFCTAIYCWKLVDQ